MIEEIDGRVVFACFTGDDIKFIPKDSPNSHKKLEKIINKGISLIRERAVMYEVAPDGSFKAGN